MRFSVLLTVTRVLVVLGSHRRVTLVKMVVQPGALKKPEGHAANFVLVHSAIRVELDAQDQLGGDCLGAGRNLTHFVHALVHRPRRGQLLAIVACHSRHCGEVRAALADFGVQSNFR